MRRFIFPLLFFLFFGARAQVSQSVIVDRINTKDLTNPFVSALFQDEKGYLWVGTLGGLNKYNGYGFTKYHYIKGDENSLSNPAITCFNQTNINEIFIGTRNGLSIYNYNNDNFKRSFLSEKIKNASAKNNINCMVSNGSGEKILGTNDGVFMYHPSENIFNPITTENGSLLEGWSVRCMCIDRLGNLWMGAGKNDTIENRYRVFKYNFVTQKLLELTISGGSSDHSGISEDYLGNIWVAVNDGLVSVNPGTHKTRFYKAPGNFYSNVSYTHAKDNVIWQCFWSFGLTAFDIDKKTFRVYKNDPGNTKSLMSNKCWAVLRDDNDIVWIGCDVGLQKITSKRPAIEIIRKKHFDEKNSFRGNIITAVLASRKQNNVVFAGVDGEGFSIYNRQTKKSVNFGPNAENKNSERFVNQFAEDENGNVYVIGQNNFQRIGFSNGSPSVKSYFNLQEHYGASCIQDPVKKDTLWIGCRGEIFCFEKKNQNITFFKSPAGIKNLFYSAFVAGNHIYFGHRNGLLKMDPATLEFENIKLPDVGNLKSALALNNNEVILSSQYFGLIKLFVKSGKYEIVYKSKNEFYSEPSGLLLYKNNVWLTGNGGLTCLDQSTGEFSEVTVNDGLPSEIVHKADLLDGYFYLGTQEGLAIINPDFQVSHFITPKTDVTQFLVLTDNTSFVNLKSGAEINLKEDQNSFRINFTVLDFNLPEKNRFKFRLSPVQNEWAAPVGENFLIFNSLPAGNYKFELLGSNADQIWAAEPFVIKIKIVPPFYKTRWFYLLAVCLLIVSVFTFMYFRLRSDARKKVFLEKIIKERTAEIQLQRAELLDSITYARRIQKAIFVGEKVLKDNLPESFIYYKPKDKVSGDFYWIGKTRDLLIIFAGDCTGHGVPGAMLSIVGTSLLNKIVHEENIYLPGEILTRLNHLFYNQLSLDADNIRDGMDASVLTVNMVNHSAYFSGAKLDAVCISNNNVIDLKGQRLSIGDEQNAEFTTQSIPLGENRFFYLYSDGIRDQHGGPAGKKLSAKRFREILLQTSTLPVNEQKHFVFQTITDWKNNLPQTDDMILIGIKF